MPLSNLIRHTSLACISHNTRTLLGGRRKGGALQVAEKLSPAYNHPGAQGATPPESGGELLKTLPSSDEEGWRAERRGGAEQEFTGGAGKAIRGRC